ncbi:curli biogenesis system outer membrane secretion channel CsgG [Desulfobaculum xiamenense]|uniref:Curli biogenesis system outer membrane secretion channel CsgG n=1 Tax=Desulfobaculum xiamenense TaxID=995050 RepID=A0A846QPW0_9BACT|nr:CsgG/HfaB family protein [Desulfobaculum xiamenense]NJB69020.1 curli biogenesis system outer membrane secretion channel CsgG [Desulfobaculum xiamenense]
MLTILRAFLVALACFSLAACATVSKPEVHKTEGSAPVASPAIEAAKTKQHTGLKRKVALARFSNETRFGQSFFVDKNNDRIGKQALDILSSKLMETEKFIMLERADLDKINAELALGQASALHNMADYLIVGSITGFGRRDGGKVGIFSRTKEQVAFAKVHIRLIDVHTGEIIYSEEGEGEASSEAGSVLGIGARAGYDATLNDKAIEAAITNLSSNIIENLLDKPWRGYILGHEDGQYIISGGASQGIKAGDVFDVMREGKKINNPQTNMVITLPGKKVASLRVTASTGDSPTNEVSFCEAIEGALPGKSDFANCYIQEHI